jgi:hypothetical protein
MIGPGWARLQGYNKERNARNREAGMPSCLVHPSFPLVRVAFIAVLTLLLVSFSTPTPVFNNN